MRDFFTLALDEAITILPPMGGSTGRSGIPELAVKIDAPGNRATTFAAGDDRLRRAASCAAPPRRPSRPIGRAARAPATSRGTYRGMLSPGDLATPAGRTRA